jgi:hypothetical protein
MLGFQWRIVDLRVSKNAKFFTSFLRKWPIVDEFKDFPDFLDAF